jgi:hypothetical protein
MGNIREIEDAISRLSPRDLSEFRRWFADFDSAFWDRQFEADAEAGQLDKLAKKLSTT